MKRTLSIFYCCAVLLCTSINAFSSEQQSLEFHGYFRDTMGASEHGSTQTHFIAPGARGKYRLGNEPNTNMELEVDYLFKLKQPDNDKASIKGVIMLDGYKNQGESNDFGLDHLAQAYVSFDHLFNNDVKIWIGRRYYERKSIHIINHFWLNPGQNSHAGVGFEDLSAGSGKLNLALFRNEDDFETGGKSYLINSSVLDARWHSLKLGESSKLTLWGKLARRHKTQQNDYESKGGYGAGFWLDSQSGRAKNTLALLYQTGAAITQSDFNPNPVREDQGWILDDATAYEVNNAITYEALPSYSFQALLLYRQEDRGQTENSHVTWTSAGIRPLFYFSKHVNLAFELGVDQVKDEVNDREGQLNKFTTALQISADRGFTSRPVLRIFVTMAEWSDDFRGQIGNKPGDAPYGDDTKGWSAGAQVEAWW